VAQPFQAVQKSPFEGFPEKNAIIESLYYQKLSALKKLISLRASYAPRMARETRPKDFRALGTMLPTRKYFPESNLGLEAICRKIV
jgi:hypothetical protein